MSIRIATAFYGNSPVRMKLLTEFLNRNRSVGVSIASAEYLTTKPLTDPLFYKENLLNVVILHEMVSSTITWMDSDVMFVRPDWKEATEEALEKYDIVQMFGEARDLNAKYEEVNLRLDGFAWRNSYQSALLDRASAGGFDGYSEEPWAAFGFAWAAKAKVLEELGGLCDINPLVTAGDDYTAMALMGRIEQWWKPWLSDEIKEAWLAWQNKAKGLKVGYVPGLLHHYWHGPRETREYQSQWDIVKKYNFTPSRDLYRDEHGLWRMKDPEGPLAQDLRALQQRKESNGSV